MQEVVGVALIDGGRVLAARRSRPEALAGLWELPGGKVEPGEDPATAAAREILEELGCTVTVTGWLDGSSAINEDVFLRVAVAHLAVGDPVPSEHDAVRWLRADELDGLRWVDADVAFLGSLRALLGAM